MKFTTPIIPINQTLIGTKDVLDFEAICVFVATGFFLDNDTYFKSQKTLRPGRHYVLDSNLKSIKQEELYFNWKYNPKERKFNDVVEEFGELFETITQEQTENKRVILPLSGGLDSRTQAVALKRKGAVVSSYSYSFDGGHNETSYAKKIAKECGFSFQNYLVEEGYLWDRLGSLAEINQCYSEFTHPRQMAFLEKYSSLGDVFSLGHWGDVLFDDMGVEDGISIEFQVHKIINSIVKPSGRHLAEVLWEIWDLPGEFSAYLEHRISTLLSEINIPESANSQIRAFKSLYWAPRWTSINLSVFESVKPITLPYYDNRICEFICSVPERFLEDRKIQIAYIQQRMPELAKITWQAQRPFNLYSFHYNKIPWNVPFRVLNKLKRALAKKSYVQRNWELQFLGDSNDQQLKKWLFSSSSLNELIPLKTTQKFYDLFNKEDAVSYSHAVSMLLTLSLFSNSLKS